MSNDRSTAAPLALAGMSRRTLVTRAAAGAIALTGSTRAGSAVAAPPPFGAPAVLRRALQPAGRLSLVYFSDAIAQEYWEQLFELFRQDYPGIELMAQSIAGSTWAEFSDQVVTRIAGGQPLDVVQIATEGQRLLASRDLLEPLDAYLTRDEAELVDYFADVDPNFVKWNDTLSSPDGRRYFLPGEFNTMIIWYNADVFQAAGVPEPTDDWTWDDFSTTAEALTRPGETYGMFVHAGYFSSIMPWLLTNGASSLSADWTMSTVNSPQAIESAQFMRSLVERQISPEPGGEFDEFASMAQGQLAMMGAGRWPLAQFRRLGVIDRIKCVDFPQRTGKGTPVGWNAYPILRASENKEAAWAFVKFMATPKASEFLALQGAVVPPRQSITQSPAFLENSPIGIEKLYTALAYGTPIPAPDRGAIIEQEIVDTFEQILVGNVSAEDGLNELHDEIESNLE